MGHKPKSVKLRLLKGHFRGYQYDFPYQDLGERTGLTQGKLKEAVFQIAPATSQWFVDLFAGSGQMGLEAWSRDYSPVLLCELEGQKVQFLHQQVRRLQQRVARQNAMSHSIFIKKINSLELLKRSALIPDTVRQGMAQGCGVLFCDPPFIREKPGKASLDFWHRFFGYLELFCQDLPSLTEYTVSVMVHLPKEIPSERVLPSSWQGYSVRQYGSQRLLIVEAP